MQKYIGTIKTGRKDSHGMKQLISSKNILRKIVKIDLIQCYQNLNLKQCIKSFWFDVNNVEPTNPTDEAAEASLSAGNEVGDISKRI